MHQVHSPHCSRRTRSHQHHRQGDPPRPDQLRARLQGQDPQRLPEVLPQVKGRRRPGQSEPPRIRVPETDTLVQVWTFHEQRSVLNNISNVRFSM